MPDRRYSDWLYTVKGRGIDYLSPFCFIDFLTIPAPMKTAYRRNTQTLEIVSASAFSTFAVR